MAGLLLAGCGGGGDDGEDAPIAKGAFVKQANKICVDANRKLQEELTSVGDLTALTLALLNTEIAEITALGAPTGDQVKVEAFLTPMQEAITTAETKGKGSITKATEQLEEAEKSADAYGVTKCPLAS